MSPHWDHASHFIFLLNNSKITLEQLRLGWEGSSVWKQFLFTLAHKNCKTLLKCPVKLDARGIWMARIIVSILTHHNNQADRPTDINPNLISSVEHITIKPHSLHEPPACCLKKQSCYSVIVTSSALIMAQTCPPSSSSAPTPTLLLACVSVPVATFFTPQSTLMS